MIGAIVAYFKDILSVFKSLFLSLYSDAFAIESSLHLRDDDDNFDHVYKYVCNCCVPRDTMLAVRGQTKGSESTAEEELGRLAALQRQQRDTGHPMRGYHGFSSDSAWEKIPIEMVFRPAHGGTHKFVYSPYKMINDDRKKLWLQHQIDAMKWEFDKRPNQKLEVFSWSDSRHYGEGWMKTVTRDARSKSSVFFDGDLMEELIADAKHFYNPKTIEEVYRAKGKPHRRGYLL